MSETTIRVDNIGKLYRLGIAERHDTLRDSIVHTLGAPGRVWKRFSGRKPATNSEEWLWALRNVSFEVKRGELVGIIGRNGAGKSTLLKVLSRITAPTEGHADITGRIGSLLEVGTGFHPELSGRENIFLNGAILGMRKAEIARKFDEIVAFSEVEKFIDTPVKHYSSGMYMRLAFAVAAHIETEILMVDEVLAVGDAEFQKKCLGKMSEVTKAGRTVLFVSHNMGAISKLCNRAILLERGEVKQMGNTLDIVRAYYTKALSSIEIDAQRFQGTLSDSVEFQRLSIGNDDLTNTRFIRPAKPILLSLAGFCRREVPSFRTTLSLYREGIRLLTMHDVENPETLPIGPFRAIYEIPASFLRPGEYSVAVGGYRDGMNDWIWATDVSVFTVGEEWGEGYDPFNFGFVNLRQCGTRVTGDQAISEPYVNADGLGKYRSASEIA